MNMRKITLSEYNAIPEDYRGIWTVERWDLPDWAEIREKHIGKRTMMVNAGIYGSRLSGWRGTLRRRFDGSVRLTFF